MTSLYKVYAMVLAERLRKKEENGIIPQNQTGFRRGILLLSKSAGANRQIEKKKGKMAVLFVDLKAAFDSVDRGKLVEAMRERGIRIELIDRRY